MKNTHDFPDLIIINAEVITMTEETRSQQALAVKDGKIVRTGPTDRIRGMAGPSTSVLDLNHKTVLPGFIDSHSHMFFGGFAEKAVNLAGTGSITEIQNKISLRSSEASPGKWIHGAGYCIDNLKEKRNPTRHELDSVSPHNPVWVTPDSYHSSVANSIAFNLIGLPSETPGIERDPHTGEPTGLFSEDRSNVPARRKVFSFLSELEVQGMIKKVDEIAISRGVTTIHAFEGSRIEQDLDIFLLLRIADQLTVRIIPYYETFDVAAVKKLSLPRIGGCGRCTLDGMPNSYSAALIEPYSDLPHTSGALNYTQKEIDDFVLEAHSAGLQIAMHAMGDAAIEQLICAYEKAIRRIPRKDHRHRIEHFHLPTEDQVKRAKSLDLLLALQPVFSSLWGGIEGVFFSRFGKKRYNRVDRFKDLLDGGFAVCGGADPPAAAIDPIRDMYLATNNIINPKQSVSVKQAIEMFTINGARAAFEERQKGTIEPGKLADLVVLDTNPFNIPVSEIQGIQVEMTIIGGKVVYMRQNG